MQEEVGKQKVETRGRKVARVEARGEVRDEIKNASSREHIARNCCAKT